jgi:ATP-dependent RNA helicase DeaD
MRFNKLGIKEEILRAIDDLGFEYPTPIQEKIIPEILDGNTDLVGLAQTGTGKTAAFGLPMIQLVDAERREIQGLVLCPTRELCLQIIDDLKRYARYLKGFRIAAVYGGVSIRDQIQQVKKGAHIVVATPGRLLDLINRNALDVSSIKYAVLDEADEMLNMGFKEDIDAILAHTPSHKRTWLFSATMPREAERLASAYMSNPVQITLGSRNRVADNIGHICYVIKEKDRYPALKRIIDYVPDIFGLIFCRTREETRIVAEKLMKDGYNADALHGDLSQSQRSYVMGRFRDHAIQMLVATDVAARGLDVDDITHVINYNLPDEPGRYTHRSGRTARAGKSGTSMVLVNPREVTRIREVERQGHIQFHFDKIPDGRSICEKRLYDLVDKMVKVDVNGKEIEKYLPPVYEALSSLSKEDLIQRFVSTEFNRFLDYYRDAGDINAKAKKRTQKSHRSKNLVKKNSQRFFINVGRLDKLREKAIARLVCDKAGITLDKLGGIALKREFSFFDVEKSVAKKVLKSLKGTKYGGRRIHARFADSARQG